MKTGMLTFGSKFIEIETYIEAGLAFRNIKIDPIVLSIDCSDAQLGQAIKNSLFQSEVIEDASKRMKYIQQFAEDSMAQEKMKSEMKNIIKLFDYKSIKDFKRDLMVISLNMDKAIMLTPSHTRKLGGFSGINGKDITVSIDAMDEAVGIAAREAMSLCTSIYK